MPSADKMSDTSKLVKFVVYRRIMFMLVND